MAKNITCFTILSRILQFPRPVKLEDLRAKAKVVFGQSVDLHYANNEVSAGAGLAGFSLGE